MTSNVYALEVIRRPPGRHLQQALGDHYLQFHRKLLQTSERVVLFYNIVNIIHQYYKELHRSSVDSSGLNKQKQNTMQTYIHPKQIHKDTAKDNGSRNDKAPGHER